MSRSGAPYLNQDISVFDRQAVEQSSSTVSPTFADRVWTGNEEIGPVGLQEKKKNLLAKSFSYFKPVGGGGGELACKFFLICYIVCARAKRSPVLKEANMGTGEWS